MSKSTPQHSVYAAVIDDDGALYDLTAYYNTGENKFEAIEAEAKERGIRYVTTIMCQLQED